MRSAIDMVPRKLPDGEYSHTGAWAFLRGNQLKHATGQNIEIWDGGIRRDWRELDTVYLYHTMDFEPEHDYLLNIFDGPQEHTAKFFERLIFDQHKHIKFISLDYPMPNYGYRCKRKRDRAGEDTKMSDYWRNVDWDAVQAKCDSITDWTLDPGLVFTEPFKGRTRKDWANQLQNATYIHTKLTIGDSHAPSAYTPKSLMLRKDGRTLNGILKKSIKKEVNDFGYDFDKITELTCYWGNIDIRHHICREADPIAYTKDLIARYAAELQKYDNKKIEVVCPLPIEDESRKLPTTGLYKGTPFFGTRAERQQVVDVFSTELQEHAAKNGWSVFKWPDHWHKTDGEDFMNTYMERPRSVHLARKFYRWDLANDVANPLLVSAPKAASLLQFD